jgi:hypothetical protein
MTKPSNLEAPIGAGASFAAGVVCVSVYAHDAAAAAAIRMYFGETVHRSYPTGGAHFLYLTSQCTGIDVDLKPFGISALVRSDIFDATYWGEPEAEMAEFDLKVLQRLALEIVPREGSSELGLNDILVSFMHKFMSQDQLIDLAFDWSEEATRVGLPPIDEDRVERIARQVYLDYQAGKIKDRILPGERRASASVDVREIRSLTAISSDALHC